ncbi:F-box protein At4g27050-like [Triticum aestivum]|uniref:F-box protein At4g27050-like n=1 Tax=Triticum aestivum TaxID=4565 RepID=UPI001D015A14|nr:F-box protein At4g27050-like [Triticum aestivum]
MAAAPTNSWCGEDRLSDLPEDVLGIILSYLPTKEAARAAVLRRSWRHSLAAVDAMSFIQDEAHDKNDPSFTAQSQEKRSKNGDFIDEVNAALLCRRRCGAGTAPRAFRVNFGCYTRWDSAMLNRWLYHVLKRSSKVLHLDVRLQHTDLAEHHVKEPYNGEGDGDCDHPRANDPTTGAPRATPISPAAQMSMRFHDASSRASSYVRSVSAPARWSRPSASSCLSSRRCS